MKGLKIVGIIVGTLVVLAGLLLALAFAPPVQTWAVRRTLSGLPGAQVEVGRVSAGLSGARLENLRYVKDGMVVTTPEITVSGSALKYIRGGRIDIDDVNVRDVVVDLSKAAPASAAKPADAGAFAGAFRLVQLPFDLRVGTLAINGKALLPANRSATFSASASGVQTGGEGKIEAKVDYADTTPAAALGAAHATAEATVHIAADRRVDAIKLDTSGTLEGPRLPPEKFQATVAASQPSAGADEAYSVDLGLARPGGFERIVSAKGTFSGATGSFSGDWQVALRTEQLSGVLSAFSLPPVALTGTGKVEYSPKAKTGAATGELTADVSKLETIAPALAAMGTAKIKTGFDVRLADNVARAERVQVEIFDANGRQLAEVSALQKAAFDLGTWKLSNFDANSDVARVSVQQLPAAWAQPFLPATLKIEGGSVSAVLAIRATPDGTRIQARAAQPIAVQDFRLRNGDKLVADRIVLKASPQIDYSGDNLSADVPDLSVTSPDGDNLAGSVSAKVTGLKSTPIASFVANVHARAAGASLSYLPVSTGALAVSLVAEGRYEKTAVQLQKLEAEVRRDGGPVLVSVKAGQPLAADFKSGRLLVDNPQNPAATVVLGELPLAWVQPFVKGSQVAGVASGGSVQVFAEAGGAMSVRSTAPVAIKGAALALDGKQLVKNLDIASDFALTKRDKSIGYELRSFEAQEAGRSVVKAQSTGEITLEPAFAVTGKGTVDADVAALGRQPLLATLASLSRGTVSASFDAASAEGMKVDAKVTARNLVLRDGNRDAGNLDASVAFASKTDGSAVIKAPVVLVVGTRRSDILVDGAIAPAAGGVRTFNGKITGDQLVVDDLMGLAAIGQSASPASPAAPATTSPAVRNAPPAPIVADAAPFWKGFAGKIATDFKQVRYGADYVITGVHGSVTMTENKLSIDGFEGSYGAEPYTATGAITFTPKQPRPYSLLGSARVTNLDVGAILKAVNPSEPPAIESKISMAANVNGTGRTTADLLQGVKGKFDVTGGPGVMRALGRKGQTVGAISGLLGIAGALQGSDTTSAIAELTSFFNSAPFDSLKISAERGDDLGINITAIEVLSPQYRMTGSGRVAHQSDGPITSQPMSLQLRLGTKDQMKFLFNRAGLLQNKTDDKGYTLLNRDFSVSGTPAKTDASDFWKFILEATVRAATGLLNGLK